MNLDLSGRVGIVTGGAKGLGAAQVKALREAGARVAVFDLDVGEVGSSADVAVKGDISDPKSVSAAFSHVKGELGRIDFLVNNAGIRVVGRLEDYPLEAWQRTLDVDLTGAFLCTQAVIPHLREVGGGKIVNIASMAGILALGNRVAYNCAKAGVIMLTKSTAYELGGEGIFCNAVAPGVMETPLTRDYFNDPDFAGLIVTNTPLGRWGQPEDVAGAVVFLCSSASDFVQGHTLVVDGGWTIGKGY